MVSIKRGIKNKINNVKGFLFNLFQLPSKVDKADYAQKNIDIV